MSDINDESFPQNYIYFAKCLKSGDIFCRFCSGKISAMVFVAKASINFMSTSMNFIVETRKLSALVISFTKDKVWHWVAVAVNRYFLQQVSLERITFLSGR